ncbi:hypothetical protein K491DRAFT_699246 [Lophiostoma macrostomum CBS 122681]|uniref:Zn(2)-C6 fungal-type domain-containing protein n=1 Tax=Lophiostoma macrostomum CBS 122681 TaxID=1314788 RepID=A0A6A6SNS5_9PLEO|nr:hypothetical protein K491DRAFT_699246 [Lophiostoma macrostomum CBS 122681]
MVRNPVACTLCRSAKQRCIHNDQPPCDRCKASGRTDLCLFPAPGTSAEHRKPKRPRQDSTTDATPPSLSASASTLSQLRHASSASSASVAAQRWSGVPSSVPSGISPTNAAAQGSPSSAATASLLDGLDPFELLTDEVKDSYLRCSYKWSFHHAPTLLLRIRDRTLEIWMAWAILALAIRFVQEPPAPFKTQKEASNAFAAHARQMLQADLETPSISRVQALLMLTGHDWGAGNGRRAWIYLGMAIRLVEVMDLCHEPQKPSNTRPTRDEFIEAEVRRRTAWTCFLMDSLLSGGKGRRRSLAAADMAIQLPCEREHFVFGEPVCTDHLQGQLRMPQLSQPVGELGVIGYSLRAANIWGQVARWACSDVVNSELPWDQASQFQQLMSDLHEWSKSLPERLQYDLFILHGHNAVDQGQAYCYMHCIYFMSHMFLHRAYLPVLGPQNDVDENPRSFNELSEAWKSWQKASRGQLFRESTLVLEMLDEMRTFGVHFVRGLVPWIGFTIYTAVGVMLYSFNFPSDEDDPRVAEKARERVIRGCTFLKDMKAQWPMAETWFETIKRMQAFYRKILGHEGPASPEERQALRRAMIDYGALQTSPVHKPIDSNSNPPDRSIVGDGLAPEGPPATSISPSPATTPNVWTPQPIVPPLEADETFDLNFDFSSADMEAMMMNATQEFWAAFPGEVGVGVYT